MPVCRVPGARPSLRETTVSGVPGARPGLRPSVCRVPGARPALRETPVYRVPGVSPLCSEPSLPCTSLWGRSPHGLLRNVFRFCCFSESITSCCLWSFFGCLLISVLSFCVSASGLFFPPHISSTCVKILNSVRSVVLLFSSALWLFFWRGTGLSVAMLLLAVSDFVLNSSFLCPWPAFCVFAYLLTPS